MYVGDDDGVCGLFVDFFMMYVGFCVVLCFFFRSGIMIGDLCMFVFLEIRFYENLMVIVGRFCSCKKKCRIGIFHSGILFEMKTRDLFLFFVFPLQ